MSEVKKIPKEGLVHENVRLVQSSIGNYCEIGPNSVLSATSFDIYSYCGGNCIFQNVKVGKFANIAAAVRIGATDHPIERPTLHHFTYRSAMFGFGNDDDEFFAKRAARISTIGHDTWIGHGALIKPEVQIGHGAIVGQGSVVTKDIPAYAIAVGNPAKVIRYRFDEDTIKELLGIAWWDWPTEVLQNRIDDFRGDSETFINKYKL